MNAQDAVRRNEAVVFRRLAAGEGGVLLHVESGQYHGLNEIGCLIWELVDGTRTVAEISTALGAELDETPSGVEQDVAAFVESLRQRDLVAAAERG